ncbi:MAG: WD40 repeat domain-containing protein [Muribaculaceae bacterium]|nr:WD40 repeat domain-containing protein [Muribaculaceae bacterium]
MNLRVLAFSLLMVPACVAVNPILAQQPDQTQTERPKTDYRFRQQHTPIELSTYNTVVYPLSENVAATMRGDVLYSTKKLLNGLQINPTGISFGVIETDKKGKKTALFYSTQEADKKIAEFDTKKYGQPSAIAYTADGRKVLVATDSGLYIFDPRKMVFIDQMELPFTPTQILMSDNGYYLAAVAGDRVAVYNFEEKKERRNWTYGVDVNDVAFNPGSSELAVLTSDGALTLYDTRSFNIKNDIEDLGEGLACSFTGDGKYIAIATSPNTIEMVNLVRPSDRNTIPVETAMVKDIAFISDSENYPILSYTTSGAIGAKRMTNLEPHFAKLVNDEVEQMMAEWQKMMPGESMEEYKLRVNDETRAKQRRLFEDSISTRLAGDLLAGQTMSLGNYDRAIQVLDLSFS